MLFAFSSMASQLSATWLQPSINHALQSQAAEATITAT
jgi:hypothetical protein